MAESIGFYFVYPDKLRSCCPEKYEFIHNRIMLMVWQPFGVHPILCKDTHFEKK